MTKFIQFIGTGKGERYIVNATEVKYVFVPTAAYKEKNRKRYEEAGKLSVYEERNVGNANTVLYLNNGMGIGSTTTIEELLTQYPLTECVGAGEDEQYFVNVDSIAFIYGDPKMWEGSPDQPMEGTQCLLEFKNEKEDSPLAAILGGGNKRGASMLATKTAPEAFIGH